MNVSYNLTGRYFNTLTDVKPPKPQNCEVPHSPKNHQQAHTPPIWSIWFQPVLRK